MFGGLASTRVSLHNLLFQPVQVFNAKGNQQRPKRLVKTLASKANPILNAGEEALRGYRQFDGTLQECDPVFRAVQHRFLLGFCHLLRCLSGPLQFRKTRLDILNLYRLSRVVED